MRTDWGSFGYKFILCMIMLLTMMAIAGCGAGTDNILRIENETASKSDVTETIITDNRDQNTVTSEAATESDTSDTEASEAGIDAPNTDDISGNEADGDSIPAINDLSVGGDELPEIDTRKKSYDDLQLDIKVSEIMDEMTLEEKVAQMFIVFPESLVEGVPCITMAGDATRESIDNIPVGGVIYMGENLKNPDQVKAMLGNIQEYSMDRIGIPLFLCVDEEGGRIARIANNRMFAITNVGSMTEIGKYGDAGQAYDVGATMGEYLSELGFNLDFAPVVDVQGTEIGSVLYRRTFSGDPEVVADLADALSSGLQSKGVVSVYKHFPGHGSTKGDPHKGYAVSEKTIDELKKVDLIPFEKGIDEDVSMIMVGHISLPNVIGDSTPASLSKKVVQELLRDDMGYDGIVTTDAMNMGAIKENYDSDEAAMLAVLAGVDIVLMPKDFRKAYNGILTAVKNREITEDRIDESVRRILRVKMGLIK